MGTVFSDIAAAISPGLIIAGTIDCIAGPPIAKPSPTTTEDSITGVRPDSPSTPPDSQSHNARPPAPTPVNNEPATIWVAALPRSANCPLNGAKSSCGAKWATVTMPTAQAEPLRSNVRIAATTTKVHVPHDESSLPQKNGPKTGSTVSRKAPRLRFCGSSVEGSTGARLNYWPESFSAEPMFDARPPYRSRSSRLSILPLGFFGSASLTTTYFGCL